MTPARRRIRKTTHSAALLVGLLSAMSAFAETQATQPPGRVRITGRVIDAAKQPWPATIVTLTKAGMKEAAAEVWTDDQGSFRLPLVPPGRYELRLYQPGFRRFTMTIDAITDLDTGALSIEVAPIEEPVVLPTYPSEIGGSLALPSEAGPVPARKFPEKSRSPQKSKRRGGKI